MGRHRILMVCVKMITKFSSSCLFKLMNVYSNATDIEKILWQREKNWQTQLFTTTHGMTSLIDIYGSKRKGYRK